MAVAHDAATESAVSSNVASYTWDHDPVGTPKGVLVLCFSFHLTIGTDVNASVTYDGVNVPVVAGGMAVDTAAEIGRVKAFFLGSSVPTTDPATIVITRTNNAVQAYGICITVTALGDVEVTGILLEQEDQALTEENIDDGSPGTNSVRYVGALSGLAAIGSIPPGANSTALHSVDLGAQLFVSARETTAGQGARPVGFDAAIDDVAAVYLAIREAAGAGATVTPAAIATIVSVPTPAPLGAAIVTPASLSLITALPTPAPLAGAVVAPVTVLTAVLVPDPTITGAVVVSPVVTPLTSALPTPSVLAGAVVIPITVSTTVSIDTPTVIAAPTAFPATIALTIALPTPTIDIEDGSVTVSPVAIALTTVLDTPQLLAGATIIPTTVGLIVAVPVPDIASAVVVAPDVIATSVIFPQPVIAAEVLVTPDVVALVINLPTPDLVFPIMYTDQRKQREYAAVGRSYGSGGRDYSSTGRDYH